MKRNILILIIVYLAIFNISCDPGVEYNPKDWKQKDNQYFVNNYEGFDLEINRIGGLIGSESILPEGEIFNKGKLPNRFKVEKAILKTNGKEYIGEQNFLGKSEIKIIKPNESQHFSLYFKLEKSLSKVLKDPVELNLVILIGEQTKEITIPMIDSAKLNNQK